MYLVWLAGAVALVVGVWWRRRVGRSRLRQQRLRYVQAYAFQPRYHDALRVSFSRNAWQASSVANQSRNSFQVRG